MLRNNSFNVNRTVHKLSFEGGVLKRDVVLYVVFNSLQSLPQELELSTLYVISFTNFFFCRYPLIEVCSSVEICLFPPSLTVFTSVPSY